MEFLCVFYVPPHLLYYTHMLGDRFLSNISPMPVVAVFMNSTGDSAQ